MLPKNKQEQENYQAVLRMKILKSKPARLKFQQKNSKSETALAGDYEINLKDFSENSEEMPEKQDFQDKIETADAGNENRDIRFERN